MIASSRDAAAVHGALYCIPSGEKHLLDLVEGVGQGYDEREVEVVTDGEACAAWTYVASPGHVDDTLSPFEWYRELVVRGAQSFGLPEEYVDALRRTPAEEDPDRDRARFHRSSLPCGDGIPAR